MLISFAHAQAAAAAAKPSLIEQLMPFAFVILIFYFLLIRPQSKRAKTHQAFIGGLKSGDSVLTSSGMFGTIKGLNERFATLEVADGVRVRILKSQIASASNEEPTK